MSYETLQFIRLTTRLRSGHCSIVAFYVGTLFYYRMEGESIAELSLFLEPLQEASKPFFETHFEVFRMPIHLDLGVKVLGYCLYSAFYCTFVWSRFEECFFLVIQQSVFKKERRLVEIGFIMALGPLCCVKKIIRFCNESGKLIKCLLYIYKTVQI